MFMCCSPRCPVPPRGPTSTSPDRGGLERPVNNCSAPTVRELHSDSERLRVYAERGSADRIDLVPEPLYERELNARGERLEALHGGIGDFGAGKDDAPWDEPADHPHPALWLNDWKWLLESAGKVVEEAHTDMVAQTVGDC
jgi:hypothetical protein